MRIEVSGLHPPPARPKPFYRMLYVQVLAGVALGILIGYLWPDFGAALKPLGDGFVKLVKMMIAPIVFCTIVAGITSLNNTREIGRTLLKSMGLFYGLTILALVTGLVAVLLIQPGAGMHISAASLDPSVAAQFAKQAAPVGFWDFVLHIIPNSFFGAFADGEVLPTLLLSVLIGFGLIRVGKVGAPVMQGIDAFSHVLFAAFGFIVKLAPLGAFGAMAFTVGRYGIGSIGSLGLLVLTFYVACGAFVAIVLGALARVQPVEDAALLPRGVADRARHLLLRTRAAGHAAEAGAAGLPEGHRRAGAADGLLVQSRRHGDLSHSGLDVHRSGL
jgi:aerobic C4-dicarboxylate transport protein